MRTLLTIAGFDPSSGAGVTADLAVMAVHRFFGMSAITALTVQSTLGVRSTHAVDATVLQATLECLLDDVRPGGVKIGMLGSAAAVEVVAAFVERLRRDGGRVPVVLDPVLRSSSGRDLLDASGVETLRRRLLGLVDWVTPNTAELAVLTGMPVGSHEEIERAAGSLRGVDVVATGGDLERADDLVLLKNGARHWLSGEKIASSATHGTGCAFSTALLCGLASGMDGLAAAEAAKHYVAEAIRRAEPIGRGKGPMRLLWPLAGGDDLDSSG